jgi:metal-dependent amidase/aminoacylase/carboxypeptidase family protein
VQHKKSAFIFCFGGPFETYAQEDQDMTKKDWTCGHAWAHNADTTMGLGAADQYVEAVLHFYSGHGDSSA